VICMCSSKSFTMKTKHTSKRYYDIYSQYYSHNFPSFIGNTFNATSDVVMSWLNDSWSQDSRHRNRESGEFKGWEWIQHLKAKCQNERSVVTRRRRSQDNVRGQTASKREQNCICVRCSSTYMTPTRNETLRVKVRETTRNILSQAEWAEAIRSIEKRTMLIFFSPCVWTAW
jgi:hypothetical protein